jgi:hypothetical protein
MSEEDKAFAGMPGFRTHDLGNGFFRTEIVPSSVLKLEEKVKTLESELAEIKAALQSLISKPEYDPRTKPE